MSNPLKPKDKANPLKAGNNPLKPKKNEGLMPGVEYSGNHEADAQAEMSETLKQFKARAEAEEERSLKTTNMNYYFCVYFKTQEQMEDFLKKAGLWNLYDEYQDDATLLPGEKVAQKLGVEIEKVDVYKPPPFKSNPKLKGIVKK